MGVLYSVIPIDDEKTEWLVAQGLKQSQLSGSRAPTPLEIRSALDEAGIEQEWFDGKSPGVNLFGEADVTTSLYFSDYRGDDVPCQFYFSKGWVELVRLAVAAISRKTGPLLLFPDSGDGVCVVHGDKLVEVF